MFCLLINSGELCQAQHPVTGAFSFHSSNALRRGALQEVTFNAPVEKTANKGQNAVGLNASTSVCDPVDNLNDRAGDLPGVSWLLVDLCRVITSSVLHLVAALSRYATGCLYCCPFDKTAQITRADLLAMAIVASLNGF